MSQMNKFKEGQKVYFNLCGKTVAGSVISETHEEIRLSYRNIYSNEVINFQHRNGVYHTAEEAVKNA